MLTTIAWTINNETTYALEGSIFNAGTVVNWLTDELKVLSSSKESNDIFPNTPSTEGVYFVPAFTGMGAPYWKPYSKGIITGLTRGTNKNHIIRAGLESMAYNTYDIIKAMNNKDLDIKALHVDGGVSKNEALMQFQADILGKKIVKQESTECTVLGVIYMTGLSLGYYKNIKEIKNKINISRTFTNTMNNKNRLRLIDGWHKALKTTFGE
jgi:glycerol kinase